MATSIKSRQTGLEDRRRYGFSFGSSTSIQLHCPNITISAGVLGSNTEPMAAEFIIKNDGKFTIHDILIECSTSSDRVHATFYGNTVITPDRGIMYQRIGSRAANKSATRNCGGVITRLSFPITIDVTARFRWPGNIWKPASTG